MIPFLKAEELSGAAEVLHEKLSIHPVASVFPREVHDGETIEVRVKKWRTLAADPVDFNDPTPLGEAHDLRVVLAEPTPLRQGRPLSNKEISFFRRYDELQKTASLQGSHESKRQRLITDVARETMLPVDERRHIMMCEALRGSVVLREGGIDNTYSYGLTALTAPSTKWDAAGATIIEDIYAARDEFEDTAGVQPDTVFFSKKMFSSYFVGNTQWQAFVKANPELTKAFMGFMDASGGLNAMKFPNQPFMFADMLWVPVTGSYTDRDGTATARWPVGTLTLAALRAEDGQQVLEWASVRDEYSPQGTPTFATLQKDDPIQYLTRYADNGVPIVRLAERVQTLAVIA